MLTPLLLSGAIAAAAPAAQTDDPWRVSGSVRARAEAISGQFRPAAEPNDTAVTTRLTLAAERDFGRLTLGGEAFDSHAFGQGPRSSVGTGEVNALELVQAYVALRLDREGEQTVQLGRFTMDLGSKRLVSRQNFRNTTNAYTGARIDAPLAAGDLTAFWVMPDRPVARASLI